MLKIRLQRIGRINSPAYRIVVTEHARAAKTGNFVEKVGTYNPKTKERTVNAERVKYWMSVGAKPSDTMHNMLISLGIITGKKINVLPQYKEPVKEEAAPTTEGVGAPTSDESQSVGVEAVPIVEAPAEPVVESSDPEAREEAVEVEAEAEAAGEKAPAEEAK